MVWEYKKVSFRIFVAGDERALVVGTRLTDLEEERGIAVQ